MSNAYCVTSVSKPHSLKHNCNRTLQKTTATTESDLNTQTNSTNIKKRVESPYDLKSAYSKCSTANYSAYKSDYKKQFFSRPKTAQTSYLFKINEKPQKKSPKKETAVIDKLKIRKKKRELLQGKSIFNNYKQAHIEKIEVRDDKFLDERLRIKQRSHLLENLLSERNGYVNLVSKNTDDITHILISRRVSELSEKIRKLIIKQLGYKYTFNDMYNLLKTEKEKELKHESKQQTNSHSVSRRLSMVRRGSSMLKHLKKNSNLDEETSKNSSEINTKSNCNKGNAAPMSKDDGLKNALAMQSVECNELNSQSQEIKRKQARHITENKPSKIQKKFFEPITEDSSPVNLKKLTNDNPLSFLITLQRKPLEKTIKLKKEDFSSELISSREEKSSNTSTILNSNTLQCNTNPQTRLESANVFNKSRRRRLFKGIYENFKRNRPKSGSYFNDIDKILTKCNGINKEIKKKFKATKKEEKQDQEDVLLELESKKKKKANYGVPRRRKKQVFYKDEDEYIEKLSKMPPEGKKFFRMIYKEVLYQKRILNLDDKLKLTYWEREIMKQKLQSAIREEAIQNMRKNHENHINEKDEEEIIKVKFKNDYGTKEGLEILLKKELFTDNTKKLIGAFNPTANTNGIRKIEYTYT